MTQVVKQANKVVTPVTRYFLKASGIVIYTVNPSEKSQAEGETEPYRVCIHNGKATCTCKGFTRWHKCCHATQLEAKEQQRSEAQAAKVAAALTEAWAMVEANWQEAEVESERQDYLTLTRTTTQDTIEHIEAEQEFEIGQEVLYSYCSGLSFAGTVVGKRTRVYGTDEYGYPLQTRDWTEVVRERLLTSKKYDIVTEALAVVNAEIVSQKVGDAYEQRAEQMRADAETRRCYYELSFE